MSNIFIKIGCAVGGFVLGIATCGFVGHKYCPEAMSWMSKDEENNEDTAE